VIDLISEAYNSGASICNICKILDISKRTYYRWFKGDEVKDDERKKAAQNREPTNKLSKKEREKIIKIANQPEFANMTPNQIVPALADQGNYIASESTFYRVLKENNQLTHRGKSKPPTKKPPKPLQATGPNQIWSWDITYLQTQVKGVFFYLYMIMDVYSRKIVGWEVYDSESAEQASIVAKKAYLREGIAGRSIFLHSDNGAPMKGATMLSTLQKLGIMPSFSRPSVSNDNPYSEALFKTLKYNPGFPENPFSAVEEAREWVDDFQYWYNEKHHHSALKFVTPGQRHRGEDHEILAKRKIVYENSKKRNPERWSGKIRDWNSDRIVFLNPGKGIKKEEKIMKKII